MESCTKRKVYITTFYGSLNYGSNLQAVGLSKTISSLGYDVSFIYMYRVRKFTLKHPILAYARLINRFNRKKYNDFFKPVEYKVTEERKRRVEKVNKKYFKETSFTDLETWNKVIKERGIFVVGSDILWNPARGYPSDRFLDYAYYAGLPRFSYGASIGALKLPKKYFKAYRRYLGSMIEVGVREQSVAEMLEPIVGRKITKVVDPSLLLTREEWDECAENAEVSVPISKNGFILCYFVMNDQRYWDYVKKVKEATGKQIIVLPMHELDEQQPYDIVLDGTLYEFLWLVKNAEFICTDSFHACVASIIYQKEFYLLKRSRKAEDAKYNDLLSKYHLEDRIVSDKNEFVRKPDIDYAYSARLLEEDRKKSLQFLEETLNKCTLN